MAHTHYSFTSENHVQFNLRAPLFQVFEWYLNVSQLFLIFLVVGLIIVSVIGFRRAYGVSEKRSWIQRERLLPTLITLASYFLPWLYRSSVLYNSRGSFTVETTTLLPSGIEMIKNTPGPSSAMPRSPAISANSTVHTWLDILHPTNPGSPETGCANTWITLPRWSSLSARTRHTLPSGQCTFLRNVNSANRVPNHLPPMDHTTVIRPIARHSLVLDVSKHALDTAPHVSEQKDECEELEETNHSDDSTPVARGGIKVSLLWNAQTSTPVGKPLKIKRPTLFSRIETKDAYSARSAGVP